MPDIATAKRYLLVAILEREQRILDYRKRGLSTYEIGRLEGLSSSRIRAILRVHDSRIAKIKTIDSNQLPALFRPTADGG